MSTTLAKASFEIYTKTKFMIGFTEITGLHYEFECFDSCEEAEQWINDKGKKQKVYTIIKTYKHPD